MHAAHFVGAVEVGQCAGDPQHAMIAARGEPHGVGGVAQQRKPGGVRLRHAFQDRAVRGSIGADVWQADRGIARDLDRACMRDALGDLTAAFGGRWQDQVGGGHSGHLDGEVDAIDERTRETPLVVGGAAVVRAPLAHEAWLGGATAAAGVHRGDQHEAVSYTHLDVYKRQR